MNTTTRRILSAAAATGIVSLATAWPATAQLEEWTEPRSAPGGVETVLVELPVDDNAWEYAQVGLGALAGATAVGAAAVALRRREHGVPHPA
jgi:hypothetical protein